MKATVNVSLRIPTTQAQLLKRAARARGVALATYIREMAIQAAEQAQANNFATVPQ